MVELDDLEKLAEELSEQCAIVAKELTIGEIGDEDDISSQLVARWKVAVEGFYPSRGTRFSLTSDSADAGERNQLRLHGRRLTSRGAFAEEPFFGGDLLLVLDYDFFDYSIFGAI